MTRFMPLIGIKTIAINSWWRTKYAKKAYYMRDPAPWYYGRFENLRPTQVVVTRFFRYVAHELRDIQRIDRIEAIKELMRWIYDQVRVGKVPTKADIDKKIAEVKAVKKPAIGGLKVIKERRKAAAEHLKTILAAAGVKTIAELPPIG